MEYVLLSGDWELLSYGDKYYREWYKINVTLIILQVPTLDGIVRLPVTCYRHCNYDRILSNA